MQQVQAQQHYAHVKAFKAQPAVAATQPAVAATQPAVAATQPAVAATQPAVVATAPKRWLAGSKVGAASMLPSAAQALNQSTVVHLAVQHNPKRAGTPSAARFAKYSNGITIAAYVKAASRYGGAKKALADIAWDFNHGFITLVAPAN